MKIKFVILSMLALLLVSTVFAQSLDSDGDGVPDSVDKCPHQAGPRSNGGCPLQGFTPDRDGDGVPDYVDLCPDQPGTGYTQGCPVAPTATSSRPQVEIVWSRMDICMVGVPLTAKRPVNVRDNPGLQAKIIGLLQPGEQFQPWFWDTDSGGNYWLDGEPGWVANSAVIDNGKCVNLPMLIHVNGTVGGAFDINFNFASIPSVAPKGDGSTLADLVKSINPILIIDPQNPGDTTPEPNPGSGLQRGAGFRLRLPDGSNFGFGKRHLILFGMFSDVTNHPFPFDGALLLPDFSPGQCDPGQFARALHLFTDDPPEPAITHGSFSWGSQGLIGLLMPAIEKVHGAAVNMGDGSVMPDAVMQNLHFEMGDGSVKPGTGRTMMGDGSVMPNPACQMWGFLPTGQYTGGVTLEAFVVMLPTMQ